MTIRYATQRVDIDGRTYNGGDILPESAEKMSSKDEWSRVVGAPESKTKTAKTEPDVTTADELVDDVIDEDSTTVTPEQDSAIAEDATVLVESEDELAPVEDEAVEDTAADSTPTRKAAKTGK